MKSDVKRDVTRDSTVISVRVSTRLRDRLNEVVVAARMSRALVVELLLARALGITDVESPEARLDRALALAATQSAGLPVTSCAMTDAHPGRACTWVDGRCVAPVYGDGAS